MFETTESLLTFIISAVTVLLIAVIMAVISARRKKAVNTRMLAYGAVSVALSFGLSWIKIELPFGGSITPASMVPLIMFAYCFGFAPALIAGGVYGILQFLQGPWFLTPIQFLLDYILAFSCIALAALFRNDKNTMRGMLISIVLIWAARFVCHIAAGIMFFNSGYIYDLPWFGPPDGMSGFIYSLAYNSTYMIPEIIIMLIVTVLLMSSGHFRKLLVDIKNTQTMQDAQYEDRLNVQN